MSSPPFTSPFSHYPHGWADKPTASTASFTTAPSYPFPFPPAATSISRPPPSPAYQSLHWDAGSRSSLACSQSLHPPPPLPRLHASPSPAVLAELLQPAFRRHHSVSSSGCVESRVCELIAAAAQHSDSTRAHAEAQKDAAIGQWMQHCLDDVQRRVDGRFERLHSERSEQAKKYDAAVCALRERLAAVESGVERLGERLAHMAEQQKKSSEAGSGAARQLPEYGKRAVVDEEVQRLSPSALLKHAPTHPAAPATEWSNSAQSEEKEEDGGDNTVLGSDDELLEAKESAATEEVGEGRSCDATAASLPTAAPVQSALPRRTGPSSSLVPVLSPSQPTPAAQHSRRSAAHVPPASFAPRTLSPSAASQPPAECGARKKWRRRSEGEMLREAAGFSHMPNHSQTTAYEFPASD